MEKHGTDGMDHYDQLPLNVLVKLDNVQILESLVGRLAGRTTRNVFIHESAAPGYKNIEASSVEALISGKFLLLGENESIRIPFTSCFYFTCARWKKGVDKLVWSNSLS